LRELETKNISRKYSLLRHKLINVIKPAKHRTFIYKIWYKICKKIL